MPTAECRAQRSSYELNLPGGNLAAALAALSERTGAWIGGTEPVSGLRTAAVRGRMDVEEALRRILKGTGLRARRIDALTWRLVRIEAARASPTPPSAPLVPDVIVTARKQPEPLSGVPGAVAIYRPGEGRRAEAAPADMHAVAAALEGLAMTDLGPGRDRTFIRGVKDSPYGGFSQSTVSVSVNDARVTYDAPDPGLRLVDVDRVEVLKGPQGPLYGTGALGGVVRIVTNRPQLDQAAASAGFGVGAIAGGGPAGDASLVVNLPMVRDRAALRLVGYSLAEGGWIDDVGGRSGVNGTSVSGGRAALRIAPPGGWTIDADVALQRSSQRDSSYANDLDDGRTDRAAEPSSGSFRLTDAALTGRVGGLGLTGLISRAVQGRVDVYTLDRAAAIALGVPEAASYLDRRRHRVDDMEVRLASAAHAGFDWLTGISYLSATTDALGSIRRPGSSEAPAFEFRRSVSEAAASADASFRLGERWHMGVGGRLFRAATNDERSDEPGVRTVEARASVGLTPSASLGYEIAPDRTLYARFATAFRAGGLDAANVRTGRYDADEVRSLEFGTRLRLREGRRSGDAVPGAKLVLPRLDRRWNLRADGSRVLTAAKLPVLHAAVIKYCDALDGTADGLLADPRLCRVDPDWVRCAAGASDTSGCLTDEEWQAAERLYEGPSDKEGHRFLPGGLQPGSELQWMFIGGGGPSGGPPGGPASGRGPGGPGGGMIRNMAPVVYRDPRPDDGDAARFPFTTEQFARVTALHALNDATDPNLAPFARHGGRLILYHGWSDSSIAPIISVAYWEAVRRQLGDAAADDVLRLFMLPGMGHCGGGDGFSQLDTLTPLMAWVERGVAPAQIVADKVAERRMFPGGPPPAGAVGPGSGASMAAGGGRPAQAFAGPANGPDGRGGPGGFGNPREPQPYARPAQLALASRPILPYPAIAAYVGTGDPNAASSYRPDRSIAAPAVAPWYGASLISAGYLRTFAVRQGVLVEEAK